MGAPGTKFKIYWIGGNLSHQERKDEWIPYGADLQRMFEGKVGKTEGYEFVWKSRCTREDFAKIWADPTTAGIIWFSHGDRASGYPAAYHPYLDNPWMEPSRKELDQADIRPQDLPPAGKNLRFAVFKSCFSDKQERAWQNKAPNATVVTHEGIVWRQESNVKARQIDQMKIWLRWEAEELFEELPWRPEPVQQPRDYGPAGGIHSPDAGVPVSHYGPDELGNATGDQLGGAAQAASVSGDELPLGELLEEPAEAGYLAELGLMAEDSQLGDDELSIDQLLDELDAGEPVAPPPDSTLAWVPDPASPEFPPGGYVKPVEREDEEFDVPPPDNPFFG
jgi:hypothetical protein